MKVIYYGMLLGSDSVCPLIRELNQKSVDAVVYFEIHPWGYKGSFLAFDHVKEKAGIYLGTEFPELDIYKDYMDLSKVFIVNVPFKRGLDLRNIPLQLKLFNHMRAQKADIIHFERPFPLSSLLCYCHNTSYVMTVHDPLPHSGQDTFKWELPRKIAFRRAKHYFLLSKALCFIFMKKYNIPQDRITLNHMGDFNFLREVRASDRPISSSYILFWGQIQPHKGVEYLCEAMIKVYHHHPELKLIIAGKGKMYFDYSKYDNLDYIIFVNEFVSIPRLVTLLEHCEFAVVPYKDATQSGVVQTAFSANVPLIVTNVGDLPLSCKDGVMGKVVPPCDSDAFADAIIEMIEHPEKVSEYRDNIKNKWLPQMQWSHIADVYIDQYNKILS